MKKENFFSKLKKKCPDDDKIERTREFMKTFESKKREEITRFYLKNDVIALADVFERIIKVFFNDFEINLLYCVSLPGYTCQWGLKNTDIKLKTLQDEDMILLLKNILRGGISSVEGDRYVKSDEIKKKLYFESNNFYGHSMSQPLPFDEIIHDRYVKLDDILSTPDVSDNGYLIEVDMKNPDNVKKNKDLSFLSREKKLILMVLHLK